MEWTPAIEPAEGYYWLWRNDGKTPDPESVYVYFDDEKESEGGQVWRVGGEFSERLDIYEGQWQRAISPPPARNAERVRLRILSRRPLALLRRVLRSSCR